MAKKKKALRIARRDVITISPGNTKMGKVPSVSLTPIETCPPNLPCYKDCYVIKNMTRYVKSALKSYKKNYEIYKKDPKYYFKQIKHFCLYNNIPPEEKGGEYTKTKLFRYHVSGDIPDKYYWNKMKEVAESVPEVRFMAITKAYNIIDNDLPANLSIMVSGWPGLAIPDRLSNMPKIWMQDGTEIRIPKDAVECNKMCDKCQQCWNSKWDGKDVYIPYH